MGEKEEAEPAKVMPEIDQFYNHVFPKELEEIANRQKSTFDSVKQSISSVLQQFRSSKESMGGNEANPQPKVVPSIDLGLWGLSLSGGGIRSASFNLGVLQALAKHKLLKNIDYLSTVSGGGYMGSCLSSLMNSPKVDPEGIAFPFGQRGSVRAEGSERDMPRGGQGGQSVTCDILAAAGVSGA